MARVLSNVCNVLMLSALLGPLASVTVSARPAEVAAAPKLPFGKTYVAPSPSENASLSEKIAQTCAHSLIQRVYFGRMVTVMAYACDTFQCYTL